MRDRFGLVFLSVVVAVTCAEVASAAEELTGEWQTLVPLVSSRSGSVQKVPGLTALAFSGPGRNDPFVLGDFAVTGDLTSSAVGLTPAAGLSAAIELFRGEHFELDGVMTHTGFGGWFLLVGWNAEERSGYCISNFTTRMLRSPWHLTEIRGGVPVPRRTMEFRSLDWKREQPFRLIVSGQRAAIQIGQYTAFENQRLANHRSGAVILGTYKTAYGPKSLVLQSARVRAVAPPTAEELLSPSERLARSITPVPEEFRRLDTSRVWAFNGDAEYEAMVSPRDPGRFRLISVSVTSRKGFRYSTWLEKFEKDPLVLADGTTAWRCQMRFSNWSAALPCLARVDDENRIRLAVRTWDPLLGGAPDLSLTALEGDGIVTLVGKRTDRDVRQALEAPTSASYVEQLNIR
jgi:hypothetical protein